MVHRNSIVIGKEGAIIKLKGKKQIELFSDDNYNCYAPFYLNDALYCVREHKYSDKIELFNIETNEGFYLNIKTPKKIIGSSNDECFILDNNEDIYCYNVKNLNRCFIDDNVKDIAYVDALNLLVYIKNDQMENHIYIWDGCNIEKTLFQGDALTAYKDQMILYERNNSIFILDLQSREQEYLKDLKKEIYTDSSLIYDNQTNSIIYWYGTTLSYPFCLELISEPITKAGYSFKFGLQISDLEDKNITIYNWKKER